MSLLLEKALEMVVALPPNEQDAIACQILDSLADGEAWKKQFLDKGDVIRRMAQEAIEKDDKGETLPPADLLGCSHEPPVNSGVCFQDCRSIFNRKPKRLEGEDNVYSARIGLGYRAPRLAPTAYDCRCHNIF